MRGEIHGGRRDGGQEGKYTGEVARRSKNKRSKD